MLIPKFNLSLQTIEDNDSLEIKNKKSLINKILEVTDLGYISSSLGLNKIIKDNNLELENLNTLEYLNKEIENILTVINNNDFPNIDIYYNDLIDKNNSDNASEIIIFKILNSETILNLKSIDLSNLFQQE